MHSLVKKSKKERLETFRAFKVQHPLLERAYDELLCAIRDSNPGSIIFIYGPTGVGKTTLLEGVRKHLTELMLAELKKNPERMPVIMLQLVAPTSGSFNWGDYFKRLLIELDEPLVDHKLDMGKWDWTRLKYPNNGQDNVQLLLEGKPSSDRMRLASERTLHHRKPPVVLLDDAQHLGIVTSGRKLLDQLNTIKSIADRSETTHGLCGTYELLPLRNLNGQLSRRSIDIHLGRYHAQDEEHQEQFENMLFTFQQTLPLLEAPDLVSKWDYFYERSIGCVGVLKDWLTLSLSSALEEDSPTLTLKHLERHAPSVARCTTMLREAVDGERELEEREEARAHLREDLGLAPESFKVERKRPTPDETEQVPKVSNSSRKRRVGTRNSVRDKIGKKVS